MAEARCEGLNLNFKPYGSVGEVLFCMCNMRDVENTKKKFFGAYPNLSQIREKLYNKNNLTKT